MLLPSSLPFTSCFFSFSKPHEKDQPPFFRSHLRAGCCRYQRSGCIIWESICISEISKICFQLPCFFDLLWFRNLSPMRNILECSFRNSFPRFRLAGLSFFQGMHLQHGKPSGCQLHLHSYIPYHIQPRQGGCGSVSFFSLDPHGSHLSCTWPVLEASLGCTWWVPIQVRWGLSKASWRTAASEAPCMGGPPFQCVTITLSIAGFGCSGGTFRVHLHTIPISH